MRIFKQACIEIDERDSPEVFEILQKLLWSKGVRSETWYPIIFSREKHLGLLLDDDFETIEAWVAENSIPTDEPILIERK